MNDVELIYEAYEQVISESRPFKLPAGLKELANRLFILIRSDYDERVKHLRQNTSIEEFYKNKDKKRFIVRQKHFMPLKPHTCTVKGKSAPIKIHPSIALDYRAAAIGGNADIETNTINIYISLYDYDFSYLRKAILHELAHLYDPHLLYSRAMHKVDKGFNQAGEYDFNANTDNLPAYYTGVGYRAGKIPLEFNPKVVEIMDAHYKDEIEDFLRTLNIDRLDTNFHNFVREMFKNEYLKRKLLEKLANYAYSE